MGAGKGGSVAPVILRPGCRQTQSIVKNTAMLVSLAGMARSAGMS